MTIGRRVFFERIGWIGLHGEVNKTAPPMRGKVKICDLRNLPNLCYGAGGLKTGPLTESTGQ